nr:cupin domain-containing protein [Micromonospora sp. DSM 115978]
MEGFVRHAEQYEWIDLTGHKNSALTKLLVNPHNTGSTKIDFMVSSYAPQGYALEHTHEDRAECFYFISGTGVFDLDGVRHYVRPHSVVYVPPTIRHQIINTGMENLVFIVAGAIAEAAFYQDYEGYFVDAAKHEPDQGRAA